MRSAGHDILVAEASKDTATHQVSARLTPEAGEAEARWRARRLAVVLMAASSVAMLAILGGIWVLIRGLP
jgi:hypothetical protein